VLGIDSVSGNTDDSIGQVSNELRDTVSSTYASQDSFAFNRSGFPSAQVPTVFTVLVRNTNCNTGCLDL
jgi:hypothetical protein